MFSFLVLKLVLRERLKIFLNERVIDYSQLLKYPDKWIYNPKKKLNWRNCILHDFWYSSRNLGRTWHLVSLQRQTCIGLLPKDWTPCDQNPSHTVRTSLETWGGISFGELERLTWQAWHDHLKIPCVLLSQNMQKLSSYWPGRLISLTSFHSPGRHCAGLREKGFAKRFTQMWTQWNTIMIGMAICAPGCSDVRNFMEEPTTFWLELRPAPLEEIHA